MSDDAQRAGGAAGVEDDNPFSKDNAPKLQLIVSMRIYDALMAILGELEAANGKGIDIGNEVDTRTATRLHELHARGKILGSLPFIDLSD